jgi:hypothetical protein
MGGIETTKLAYKRSVLATNPTIARRCSNLRHSVSHWSFPLVRKPDSPRVPPASQALEGVGGTGWDVGEWESTGLRRGESSAVARRASSRLCRILGRNMFYIEQSIPSRPLGRTDLTVSLVHSTTTVKVMFCFWRPEVAVIAAV